MCNALCNAFARVYDLIVQEGAYLHVLFTSARLVRIRFETINYISPPLLEILPKRRIQNGGYLLEWLSVGQTSAGI